ncbi:MAG: arsenate reductase ArsC [Halioglobus sp.]
MKKVLVLCTGNSCRSVMAEALINQLGEGRYQAVSAGSHPTGYVHPKSLETLRRHGFSTDGFHSKSWDEFAGEHFDVVLTVCNQAASERCPLFTGNSIRLHWDIADPAGIVGTEERVDAAFEAGYSLLKERIEQAFI